MKYELELYSNDMSTKTEKIEVSGTSVSALDTSSGALFLVLGPKGSVMFVTDLTRVKSMRTLDNKKQPKRGNLHAITGRAEKEAPRGRRAIKAKTLPQ